MVLCPECENDLDVEEDDLDEGEVVTCAECGTDFEIVSVDPVELAKVHEDDEEEEDARESEEDEE